MYFIEIMVRDQRKEKKANLGLLTLAGTKRSLMEFWGMSTGKRAGTSKHDREMEGRKGRSNQRPNYVERWVTNKTIDNNNFMPVACEYEK